MSQNRFKNSEKDKNPETEDAEKSAVGNSLFTPIEKLMRFETYFRKGFPVHNMSKIFFITILVVIYIGNTHYAEKTIRDINKMETEVEDLRADYTTLKAQVMLAGKQSEVVRRVKPLGLEMATRPPFKIIVKK